MGGGVETDSVNCTVKQVTGGPINGQIGDKSNSSKLCRGKMYRDDLRSAWRTETYVEEKLLAGGDEARSGRLGGDEDRVGERTRSGRCSQTYCHVKDVFIVKA